MARNALFDTPGEKAGPVYQGVSAQFRALFPKDDPEAQKKKAELTGWTRLALSHARAIDRDPRASVGRAQVSAELRETLTTIAAALSSGDAFDKLLEELGSGSDAAPSHPEV